MNYQRPRRRHGVNCCCSANRRPRHRANASASGGEAAERRQPQAEPSCRRREREQHSRLRAEPLRRIRQGSGRGAGVAPATLQHPPARRGSRRCRWDAQSRLLGHPRSPHGAVPAGPGAQVGKSKTLPRRPPSDGSSQSFLRPFSSCNGIELKCSFLKPLALLCTVEQVTLMKKPRNRESSTKCTWKLMRSYCRT